jgi:thioredoxin reductase
LKEHKTLFVAPELAEPKKPPPKRPADSDVTRVRPAYVAAVTGCLGLGAGVAATDGLSATPGPGPLTPSHVAARLTCASCHGTVEPGAPKYAEHAREACQTCHGDHPSTRAGHQKARKKGEMSCVTCHEVHGSQTGVRFPEDGPPVRYSTFGEVPVTSVPGAADLEFRSRRTLVVPTIPERACLACHEDAPDDPLARCRTKGLGAESPTVCFDEHTAALPAAASAGAADSPKAKKRRKDRVCADQHFEDRPFVWEAAREALAIGAPPRTEPRGQWLPLASTGAAASLGYLASALVLARRKRPPRAPEVALPVTKKKLPLIDTTTCLGCHACVDACPYGVLEVQSYVAVVARPDACCGLVLCEQSCPNGSLRVADEGSVLARPRVSSKLESLDVPGLFLAGDVTGVPLIKSAIAHGVRAAEAVAERLGERHGEGVDVCVVGTGPAGISALLRAKELGLSAVGVEQGSVAQSIQNFPRGKLVFDQPLELPVAGKLWLRESTKEELLMQWTRIVRREGLQIRERARMLGLTGVHGRFTVRLAEEGGESTLAARAVILAIGQRGSPRRLSVAIPEEAESQLHYHLTDARSFAGAKVAVVGLGDVAMEAALALAAQPKTQVTIVARAATYSRGQSRNISEIERLRKAGRIHVEFQAHVRGVRRGALDIDTPERRVAVPFDALFVLIGSIPPWATLESIGVRLEARAPDPALGASPAERLVVDKTLRSG